MATFTQSVFARLYTYMFYRAFQELIKMQKNIFMRVCAARPPQLHAFRQGRAVLVSARMSRIATNMPL